MKQMVLASIITTLAGLSVMVWFAVFDYSGYDLPQADNQNQSGLGL